MTKAEISKLLYKEKPQATFSHIKNGHAYWEATIHPNEHVVYIVTFDVPVNDMGDASFEYLMPGQLLRRWISL